MWQRWNLTVPGRHHRWSALRRRPLRNRSERGAVTVKAPGPPHVKRFTVGKRFLRHTQTPTVTHLLLRRMTLPWVYLLALRARTVDGQGHEALGETGPPSRRQNAIAAIGGASSGQRERGEREIRMHSAYVLELARSAILILLQPQPQ